MKSQQELAKIEENELVEKAKTDQQAFVKLYNNYYDRIYNFILKRTGHVETAEDIVSETFIKVFNNLDKYQFQGYSFSAWLYRVASNLMIDHFRKEGKHKNVDIDEYPNIADSHSADEHTLALESQEEVKLILNKLPERERQVLELKFFAQLSNQEIAEVMKISISNTGVLIYRALKKCQKIKP